MSANLPEPSDRPAELLDSIARRWRWRETRKRRQRRRRSERRARPWPAEAIAARRAYSGGLRELVAGGIDAGPPVAVEVFSFSSQRDLPEQVASLRSFLTHLGTPTAITVVSDGSHSADARDLLAAVHTCVEVVDWDRFARSDLPKVLRDYARIGWRGRQMATMISLPDDRPVLYSDSDVLFFPGASQLRELVAEAEVGPRYLRDTEGDRPYLDRRMLRGEREAEQGVNCGFFFHSQGLDWTVAIKRLRKRPRRPRAFTGQAMVHLAMHRSGARPFDRARYVVDNGDRSILDDPLVGPHTVLRHYVSPVRHKLWLAVSRPPMSTPDRDDHGRGRKRPAPASRPNPPELIVTSISRSGSSYLCNLLHSFDNCVAINEPREIIKRLRRQEVPWGVPIFYSEMRRNILDGTPIKNKLLEGEVAEDTAVSQVRHSYTPSVASDEFVLAVKNTREFLFRLGAIRRIMPAARFVACVRNPVDTIASWKASFPHLRDADVTPFLEHRSQLWLTEGQCRELETLASTEDLAKRRAMWWTFLAERVLENRDGLLLIDYDRLTRDPMAIVGDVLDGYRPGRLRRPISPSIPRSQRGLLDKGDLRAIRTICSRAAADLDLSIPD